MKQNKRHKRVILPSGILVLTTALILGGCGQTIQTDLLGIAAPSDLVATASSSDGTNLSWSDNSDDETGFIVERRSVVGAYHQLDTVPVDTTIFADIGLAPGTTYYYRICAERNGVHSSYSNESASRTMDLPLDPPATPGGLGATALSAESIALSWTDNSTNESGFKIERSPLSGSGFTQIGTVSANVTSYTSTGLDASTIYYYRVLATNAAGDSSYSNIANATTHAVAPAAPGGLGATALSAESIALSWTDNSTNESGFKIERSLLSGSGFTQIGTVGANVTSYTSTGLDASTIYYYRVLATNAAGDSSYSNEATDRTFDVSTSQIIADHTVVSKYELIPQRYIDSVKTMLFNLPGESHSMGYRLGVFLLMEQDSKYAVSVNVTGSTPPEAPTSSNLRVSRATWGDRRGATNWRYSYGEEDFFVDDVALAATENHIAYSALNNREIDVLGFGWCWDMTWHNSPGGTVDPVYNVRWAGSSEDGPDGDLRWGLDSGDISLTGNRVTMNNYLLAVEEYNAFSQANGYRTKVIFTTGPANVTGESGYQRELKHEYIRSFVLDDPNRILFDYSDILSRDEYGNQNTSSWNGHTFEVFHPDNMLDMDGTYAEDGDHIGERGALRLGKAIWWMLARISGWDGVSTD